MRLVMAVSSERQSCDICDQVLPPARSTSVYVVFRRTEGCEQMIQSSQKAKVFVTSFLLLRPLIRLPFGSLLRENTLPLASLSSLVSGWSRFSGGLETKVVKIAFESSHSSMRRHADQIACRPSRVRWLRPVGLDCAGSCRKKALPIV